MTDIPKIRNLYQRLATASASMEGFVKAQRAPSAAGGYSFVSHDTVTADCRNALLSNGVIAMSSVVRRGEPRIFDWGGNPKVFADVTVRTTFINIDNPEERESIEQDGWCWENRDKAIASAISYATKYTFLKGLMLPTGDSSASLQPDQSSIRIPIKLIWDEVVFAAKQRDLDITQVWDEFSECGAKYPKVTDVPPDILENLAKTIRAGKWAGSIEKAEGA